MGKKDRKPGKGKEKTERKTAKAAEKRARRDEKKFSEEDDIDAILAKIQKEESKKVEIHIDENIAAPSPRCNCSVTINPLKETELILYGGEYYNGDRTFVYGDLYRYNAEKGEWKSVSSPNSPPPRSAHQAVAWKNSLFIFGGEFTSPNQEKFHHYKDLWRFDLNTNAWEQLQLKGSPSARSGHRMVFYKHKLIIFGGFYDTLREVRYYNDLHVLDLDEYKWQEIKPKPGAAWPSARSAFQLTSYLDEVFLYGGYYKEQNNEKTELDKGVVLADMWSLDPRSWEWNKIKKAGMPPGPRAGFSMCAHKKRAILFGGVIDLEDGEDVIRSTFMDEMYAFQMDNRRWYPLELRKPKAKKVKAPAKEELVTLLESSSLDDVAENVEENEVVKPCGRINASMVVGKDTLYLYGGMKEIGDEEVSLDDLYSLDLNKLDTWKCIVEATHCEWVEVDDEEDGDDDDDDDGDDNDDENEDDEEEEVEDDDDDATRDANEAVALVRGHGKKLPPKQKVEDDDDDATRDANEAVALVRGHGKKLPPKQRKAEIEKMRTELGLADSQRTPVPGETLKDFFSRTCMYWQMAAYEHTQHTGKELRKDGFDLAETRYKHLKPLLDELAKLEAEQKAEEKEEAISSSKALKGKAKQR